MAALLNNNFSFETDVNGNINFNCSCGKSINSSSIHNHLHSVYHAEHTQTELIEEEFVIEEPNLKFEIQLLGNEKIVISDNVLKVFSN